MTTEDLEETQETTNTEATETPNADHDSAYRQLFSHPVMLEDLVRHFVDASLADALDFERMAQWQADLRAPPLERRQADMIWRVPMRQEDREVMIVLHLEFQSSSDPLMALRMLEYATMIWRSALREDPRIEAHALPPVVPVVLYNGPRAWAAATDVRELVDLPEGTWFEPYLPRMRFVLLDEVRIAAQFQDEEEHGLPGLLFELEAAETQEDFSALLVRLMEQTKGATALRALFVVWFFKVVHKRRGVHMSQEQLDELTGQEDSALVQTLDRLFQEAEDKGLEQGFETGRQEGRELGLREGRAEGRAAVLEKQLERKFGSDETRAARLEAMSVEQLDALALALFDVDDEDALFAKITDAAAR